MRMLAVGSGIVALMVGVGAASAQPHLRAPDRAPAPRAVSPAALLAAQHAAGHATSEFHPVKLCRIVSTKGHGGPISKSGGRSFHAAGKNGFSGQGGHGSGCGIPVGATQVLARITAVKPHKSGVIAAFATGAFTHLGALYYQAHTTTSTEATVGIASGNGKSLAVHNGGKSPVNLTIDVVGYYQPPMHGLIWTGSTTTPGSGFQYSGSPSIVSVTWVSVGVADVTFDRDVSYCTPIAGAYYDSTYYANARGFDGHTVRVYSWRFDSATQQMVEVNNYVYLTVIC
jgi:hypothetical protein